MLHKFFTKTFVINLDRRSDRMEKVTKNCQDINLEFERFSACDGKAENLIIPTAKEVGQPEMYWNLGAAGLVVTLQRIFEKAIHENYESVFILEDDVEFHPHIVQAVNSWMNEIPADWEMLYFGVNHNKPATPVSTHVVRINRGFSTHCVAIKNSIFQIMLDKLSKLNNPLDVIYADQIHTRGKSYSFSPNLAYQEAGFSDIVNNVVNYSFLKK